MYITNQINNKILITGNRGFIGYWLFFTLKIKDYKIYGIYNLYSKGKRLSTFCKKEFLEKS
jgi:nucleoside-diphosphate-sugar epimerase